EGADEREDAGGAPGDQGRLGAIDVLEDERRRLVDAGPDDDADDDADGVPQPQGPAGGGRRVRRLAGFDRPALPVEAGRLGPCALPGAALDLFVGRIHSTPPGRPWGSRDKILRQTEDRLSEPSIQFDKGPGRN